MNKVLTGTETAAIAASLARVEVVSAYPITPQTVIVEKLAEMIGEGRLQARYLNVESEHSAMASCIGASATGARVFTATSSQGLALMHEVLHYAAGGRFPIVMVNANRALTPPWNLYCDHTDSLAQRDTGWLQYYCSDCQDVLDSILIAYRVAEQLLLPVMVNMDAFYLTHTSEAVSIPNQTTVDRFLPPFNPSYSLNIEKPCTIGNVCGPELYTSFKYKRHFATMDALDVWRKASEEFNGCFGRRRNLVETSLTEDAEIVIVAIGTAFGPIRLAAEQLRQKGCRAGALRLSMIRPFPKEDLLEAVKSAHTVAVIDRNISLGIGGIVAQEIKAALFGKRQDLKVSGIISGIGGLDITPDEVVNQILALHEDSGLPPDGAEGTIWTGVLK